MLTRIEIDGFKTFEGFSLDLSPFTAILGPNASGKSNLFDAIRLLSQIAEKELRIAVQELRGEPIELFRRGPDGTYGSKMSFAVEVLLEPRVQDPWGEQVEVRHSRIRYEVDLERRRDERGLERLVVSRELAQAIPAKTDVWSQSVSEPFRAAYLKGGTRKSWLTTGDGGRGPRFQIREEGQISRSRSAENAEATILSSITSAEMTHLYALREEMRAWRFLQLDPARLRSPSPVVSPEQLEPDGSNLAAVLARIQAETATRSQPRGALVEIAADLAALIPGLVGIQVEEDAKDREYRIDFDMREGEPYSSRVVSDGTLRVLALLTILHDPQHRSLVCFEEPENGIHPLRLRSMMERFQELVTDPQAEVVDPGEPLSQLLVNSHSPVVLSALDQSQGQVLFADVVTLASRSGAVSRKTRIRPVHRTERPAGAPGEVVTRAEVGRYLSSVELAEV